MLSSRVIGLPAEFDAPLVAIDAAIDALLGGDVEAPGAGQHLSVVRAGSRRHRADGRRVGVADQPPKARRRR